MAKVSIKGPIISNNDQWIYDWLDMDATSPKMVQEQVEKAEGQDLTVEINSGGGSVFDGSEIYTALKDYPGNVTVKIVGLAASAASVIAMAGDKVMMSPTSQMMIHNATVYAGGDYRDMDHMSNVLKNVNQTVANAYKLRTGKEDEELLSLMDSETWFTPQQALEKGFIDEIMFNEMKFAASYNNGMLPQEVIDKLKNELKPTPSDTPKPSNEKDIFMAKLNLLKLGGKDIE
jgi:ATP-dependent Clp protease, protease subunit